MNILKAKVNTSKYYNEYANTVETITTIQTGATIQLVEGNTPIGTVELTPNGFYFEGYIYRTMLEVMESYFTDGKAVVV